MPPASAAPGRRRRSPPSYDPHLRDRDDEAPSPLAHVGELVDDLVGQVPGKDQDEVRMGLFECLRMVNRDPGAGQELPLLVRVAVDRELEQVGADAAVVEQRVSLAGSAVADDAFAIATALDQELEQLPLGLDHPRRERAVSLEPVEVELPLAFGQLRHPGADRMAGSAAIPL